LAHLGIKRTRSKVNVVIRGKHRRDR
jgi:hypothetical protein